MDEAALREYVLRARKEGKSAGWIAEAAGISRERAWLMLYGRSRSEGSVVEWSASAEKALWEQRLKKTLEEGAHPSVVHLCEDQIAKATCSAPVPDAVWTSMLEFHCPVCNETGSIASRVAPENPLVYTAPHGHSDLGDGNFTCPFAGENRPWKVPQFQGRPGGAVAESNVPPDDPLITAVNRFGDQMAELIEIEKRIHDIRSPEVENPDPPDEPEQTPSNLAAIRRKVLPHNLYTYSTLMLTACVVLNVIGENVLLAFMWSMFAAMHYTLALSQAKRS